MATPACTSTRSPAADRLDQGDLDHALGAGVVRALRQPAALVDLEHRHGNAVVGAGDAVIGVAGNAELQGSGHSITLSLSSSSSRS